MSSRLGEEIANPKRCAWCNKKTKRYIETIVLGADGKYTGNSEVLPDKEIKFDPTTGNRCVRVTRNLYRDFGYGQFCKVKCAVAFANAAHRAGMRVKE